MVSNNPSSIFNKSTHTLGTEQKNIQCQIWFMKEKSQKWINNTPIEASGHGEDKTKHGFHGNIVIEENRTKMYMNITLIFQISNKLLNHFI